MEKEQLLKEIEKYKNKRNEWIKEKSILKEGMIKSANEHITKMEKQLKIIEDKETEKWF